MNPAPIKNVAPLKKAIDDLAANSRELSNITLKELLSAEEFVFVKRDLMEHLEDELAVFLAEEQIKAAKRMAKTPMIYSYVTVLRELLKLNPEVFPDSAIAAAWYNVQGLPVNEQLATLKDYLGIADEGSG